MEVDDALSTSLNTTPKPCTVASVFVPGILKELSVILLPTGINVFGRLKALNWAGYVGLINKKSLSLILKPVPGVVQISPLFLPAGKAGSLAPKKSPGKRKLLVSAVGTASQ